MMKFGSTLTVSPLRPPDVRHPSPYQVCVLRSCWFPACHGVSTRVSANDVASPARRATANSARVAIPQSALARECEQPIITTYLQFTVGFDGIVYGVLWTQCRFTAF